jgi:hypothetical protein
MVMKKRTFVIFIAYVWTQTLLGLTFTPYKSVREVTKRPILLPVIFSPVIGVIMLLVLGKIASFFIFVSGTTRELIALFLSTTLLSILFWQLLLLYLLGSFLFAYFKKLRE